MKTEKITIFVVDDSPVALDTIVNELQRTIHCNVKGFSSAEDCLFRMEDGLPDLILSDYYLDALYQKKMNGDQMLALIKSRHPSIPVIMYSSQNSVEVVIRLMKLGAIDFIPKEKNFIKTVGDITSRQINKIKTDTETSWFARGMIFILAVFITALALIHIYSPGSVEYFVIGLMVIVGVAAFAASSRSGKDRHSENLN
jgi:DNA-binding NtrC family response regulator